MTVAELIRALSDAPKDARVAVRYDAGCCFDDDLEKGAGWEAAKDRFVIDLG